MLIYSCEDQGAGWTEPGALRRTLAEIAFESHSLPRVKADVGADCEAGSTAGAYGLVDGYCSRLLIHGDGSLIAGLQALGLAALRTDGREVLSQGLVLNDPHPGKDWAALALVVKGACHLTGPASCTLGWIHHQCLETYNNRLYCIL